MSERSASQTNGASTPPSASGSQADTPSSLSDRPALLSQYLNDLAMRPSQDPFLDLPEDLDLSSSAFATPAHSRNGLSLANGGLSAGALSSSAAGSSGKSFNPEADSFVYIEHLLEALAVLGRLGWALDALAQRESSEIFSLVDGTIQEVEERSVDRRRQTMMNLLPSASFLPPPPSAETKDSPTSDDKPTASTSGLAGKLDEDSETLRDLYWTMYSKLDAVLQGFRVTSEVASRIGSVRSLLARFLSNCTDSLYFFTNTAQRLQGQLVLDAPQRCRYGRRRCLAPDPGRGQGPSARVLDEQQPRCNGRAQPCRFGKRHPARREDLSRQVQGEFDSRS